MSHQCSGTCKDGKRCRNMVAQGIRCYIHRCNKACKKSPEPKKIRSRTKSSLKSSPKSSPRTRPRSKLRSKKPDGPCKKYFKEKIGKNMKEYNAGRWKSRSQAIAVSYSQTRKKRGCARFGKKSPSK